MASEPRVDFPWPFLHNPPILAWQASGLLCATSSGMLALNGYVRLPDDHRVHGLGYDEINEVISVHGGLTYGCDELGWVGFDTSHAFDKWSDEELARAGYVDDERSKMLRDIFQKSGLRPKGDAMANSFDTHWTLELLTEEINNLARQLAALRA